MRHVHVPTHHRSSGSGVSQHRGSQGSANYNIQREEKPFELDMSRRGPSTQVELSFSARNLANRDFTSKSDPVCIIYRGTQSNGKPRELARTEMIRDNLSPDWTRRIKIDYYFEAKQPLLFKIFDIDFENGKLNDQDFLGSAHCDLADIVAAPNNYLTLKLEGANFVRGDIIVHAQEIDQGQRETLCFNAHVSELAKKSIFASKPNAFLDFYRFLDDGTRHLALRTKVYDGVYAASWEKLEIPLRNLCDGDRDRQFLVECYDYSYDGHSPTIIGSTRTTVNQLLEKSTNELQFLRQRSAGKKPPEKLTGLLRIDQSQVRIDYTFLDYISGGLQLEFGVCVDFTASNGQPHSITSLHYIDPQKPNQYEMAIRSVLEICQHYNQQKLFEATGFGARFQGRQEVSHLFPLDLNQRARSFIGVEGVVNAYRECIKQVELYGPTHFAPSINEFVHKASRMPQDGSQYQILLILTDGAIGDMSKTKELIIKASELPMSIIIIGVGNDTFEKMDQLDSDATLLRHNGRQAKRDIVQFVPFNQFVPASGQFANEDVYIETMRLLAKEVLSEVPEQVTSYMRYRNLKPREPKQNSIPPTQPIAPFEQIPQTNTAPYPQATPYPPAQNYYGENGAGQPAFQPYPPATAPQSAYGFENLNIGNGAQVQQPFVPNQQIHNPPYPTNTQIY